MLVALVREEVAGLTARVKQLEAGDKRGGRLKLAARRTMAGEVRAPVGALAARMLQAKEASGKTFDELADELGWTNAAEFGNACVCGESDAAGLPGCAVRASWAAAAEACAARRRRRRARPRRRARELLENAF